MSDIVTECRDRSDKLSLPYEVKVTLLDAATTIERLRAALEWAAVQFANHNLPAFSHQCRVYAEGK